MNKLLSAAVLAAATSFAANAALCNNGGFYVGANLAAAFDKVKVKIDNEKMKTKLKEGFNRIFEQLDTQKKLTEFLDQDDGHKKLAKEFTNGVGELFAGLDAANEDTALTGKKVRDFIDKYKNDKGNPISNAVQLLDKILAFVPNSDKTTLLNTDFKHDSSDKYKAVHEAITKALNNVEVSEQFSKFIINLNTADLANIQTAKYQGQDVNYGNVFSSFNRSDVMKQITNIISRHNTIATLAKDSDAKFLFYTTDKDGKDQMVAYQNMASNEETLINKSVTQLVGDKETMSKKATGFLMEAFAGWDTRINDIKLGISAGIGSVIGGKVKFKGQDDVEMANVKRNLHISLAPTIDYMITPEFSIGAAVGISYARYKLTYTGIANYGKDRVEAFNDLVEKYNKTLPESAEDADKLNAVEYESLVEKSVVKKNKVGLMLQLNAKYFITDKVYTQLFVAYEPNRKLTTIDKDSMKTTYSSFTLGAGLAMYLN